MRLPHRCIIQKRTQGAADAYGEAGVPTWADDQPDTHCRFYDMDEDAIVAVSGEAERTAPMLIVPPTATLARETYRITTAQPGYAGTYVIDAIRTRQYPNGDVHHYTVALQVVQA